MCQQGTHPSNLYSRLREGLRFDLLGQRWLAIQSLEDLLREHPEFHEARGHLAWIYSLQGNDPAAIDHLTHWAAAQPDNASVLGRLRELEHESTTIIGSQKNLEEVYREAKNLAADSTRKARNSHRQALIRFRELWEKADYRDSGRFVSHLAYLFQDHPTSLRATQFCLAKNPGDLGLRKWLGLILESMGCREEAIETYQECLARDPSDRGVRLNLTLLEGGDAEEILGEPGVLSALLALGEEAPALSRGSWISKWMTLIPRGSPKKQAEKAAKRLRSHPGFQNLPCNLCGQNVSREWRSGVRIDGRFFGAKDAD